MNRLLFLSYNHYPENIYIPPHTHACFEIVYYFDGHGSTTIGAARHEFKPNHFAVISPHILHDEKHAAESDLIFIGFLCDNLSTGTMNKVFEDDDRRTIAQYMLRMKHEFIAHPEGFSEVLNVMVEELATQIKRISGIRRHNTPNRDSLNFIINYMDENFRHKLAVSTLAQMTGYSYDRFRHLFKEKFGVSPQHYLLLKRLEYAKMLLIHTRTPVSDIAVESGFVNSAQFCTLFKRETGMTPKTFRRQLYHAEE
ncbi:helix-turn-helix transcriptional regulator [Cohnella massiliensis]|uniref:helix-turn-helix transcriptional regulator n=1 Tax=Cohnella massiliensis TaxID=1816691 RepID=UPI0009B9D140|nr:AraC family transcriptional regulator [Cohnella massiliensis]